MMALFSQDSQPTVEDKMPTVMIKPKKPLAPVRLSDRLQKKGQTTILHRVEALLQKKNLKVTTAQISFLS